MPNLGECYGQLLEFGVSLLSLELPMLRCVGPCYSMAVTVSSCRIVPCKCALGGIYYPALWREPKEKHSLLLVQRGKWLQDQGVGGQLRIANFCVS